MMRYFLGFLFLTSYLFGFDYHLKPYVISEGISCFFGLPSNISKENGGNMINSCYIETKEGYIVIDSGPTYSYAQSTYEIMKKEKNLPVKYVINTSSDEVHILGNDFFKEQGAILIGSKSYEKHLIKNKKLLIADKISSDAFLNTRLVPLDNYLVNDLDLLLEDLKVSIKLIKNDNEHLIVYLPSKKIVFAGDMIFNNRIVALKNNRSILVWQEGLELLKSLPWDDIVSSHGYMTRRSALKNTESYLSLLKSEVKSSLLSGESKENAIKNIKLSAFSEDKLYDSWHKKNVASVYDELMNSKKIKSNKTTKSITSENKKSTKIEEVIKKEIVEPKRITKIKKIVPTINYVSFDEAIKSAKANNKIIFLKVRSTTCKYCDELDSVIANDNSVKEILNSYFETVSINSDYDAIPYNMRIEHTPTLIFLRANSEEPLMNLTGINALGEFLEVLEEVVNDGHNGGYLKL
jgi:glyoxylase-like metal-dependent hydrolase (beta-lactamase superfamily II)